MSYRALGYGPVAGDVVLPTHRLGAWDHSHQLGQWEMIGSAAAGGAASYGTMLWGTSPVSDFFGTIYGQVVVTALNAVGEIWGIPLGSIVEAVAELFGGLFGSGKSHAQREADELKRTVGNLRQYVAQIQHAGNGSFADVYNVLVLWSSKYVGGSCPGPLSGQGGSVPQCIAISVRPMAYAPPDVQPVTKGAAGASLPGARNLPLMAFGSYGLGPNLDVRTLDVGHWPWVMVGHTSHWYATASETGFYRALLADPTARFQVGVQQGITQSKLVPLNQQIADAVRGTIAKIIQRDYGPAIAQALAIAEAVHAGTLPTAPETRALMQRAGIAPGVIPTPQQVAAVMAPAAAASPGTAPSLMPALIAGAVAWLTLGRGGS
jgi:hypothetical protein